MAKFASVSAIEKVVSFGGICTIIGVVGDLLTPIGNYTLLSLGVGALILLVGLVLWSMRGLPSSATQATLAFGAILSGVSLFFLMSSPGDRGVIASEVEWVALRQEQLLGLSQQVQQIARDTTAIVQSTKQIADDTKTALDLSYSSDGFASALYSEDSGNITAYCQRGYRADSVGYLLTSLRKERSTSDGNFALLQALECFDTATICEPENWKVDWHRLAPRMDDERVEALCGARGVTALRAERAEIIRVKEAHERSELQKYDRCMKQYSHHAASLCDIYKRKSTF